EGLVGFGDQILRDAVVADAGKAPLAVRGAQLIDEGLAVFRAGGMGEAADVEGGDSRCHGSLRKARPGVGTLKAHDTARIRPVAPFLPSLSVAAWEPPQGRSRPWPLAHVHRPGDRL